MKLKSQKVIFSAKFVLSSIILILLDIYV